MKNEINVDVVADTTDDLQELMADAEDPKYALRVHRGRSD